MKERKRNREIARKRNIWTKNLTGRKILRK